MPSFTLTPDAGFEIDNVDGTCGGTLASGVHDRSGHGGLHRHRQLQAVPASTHVRISQIYGGGGNTGATFSAKYVELFNPGSSAVALTGMSVQYAVTGTNWSAG